MKRVLFYHPTKGEYDVPIPHLGLASLAAVLKRAGHEVTVYDEVLFSPERMPPLAEVIQQAQPDVVGVSAYTATLDRVIWALGEIRRVSAAPLLVGGPHASLWPEQLAACGADYVVIGEAEERIVELVDQARRRSEATVVHCAPPQVTALPWPDYTAFLAAETITTYPLMTSRGCPYRCSFCAVRRITSQRWRPRDPEDCAREVAAARRTHRGLQALKVSDDCPTARPEHFKSFLRYLAAQQPPLPLTVDNTRADSIDDELLALLKAAGAVNVCLGVEHGNPQVFALVNKGETLDDIRRAARLVKQHGLPLGLCFIIDLPGDSFARTRDSIRLARELRPDYIFWNMAHPFPGTEMYEWFQRHGARLDPPRQYTSYDFHSLVSTEAAVETSDFSRRERQRAYFLAVVETDQYVWLPGTTRVLLREAWRFRLLGPALRSLARRGTRATRRMLRRLRTGGAGRD